MRRDYNGGPVENKLDIDGQTPLFMNTTIRATYEAEEHRGRRIVGDRSLSTCWHGQISALE